MEKLPYCQNEISGKISEGYIYVSTLDGRLTALNLSSGKLEWTIKIGTEELLSSSIQNLELTNNGQPVRLIPSLEGDIYQFDGKYISKTSVSAENLLSSTFKFSDDIVVVGGKETRSYGVSVTTGQILYECSMHGCLNNTDQTTDHSSSDSLNYIPNEYNSLLDEVIVVRHETKTVRAIEPRTGLERWNFSVGHHKLELLKSKDCHDFGKLNMALINLDIKVSVKESTSIICAFSKDNPNLLLWQYTFKMPIANLWMKNFEENLQNIDVFHLPHCIENDEDIKNDDNMHFPSIYLGIYQKQFYVQEPSYYENLYDQFELTLNELTAINLPLRLSAVKNSKELQQLTTFKNKNCIEKQNTNTEKNHDLKKTVNPVLTALTIFKSPKDLNRYYSFLIDEINKTVKEWCNSNDDDEVSKNASQTEYPFLIDIDNTPVEIIIISLWFWWKEIVVISLTTALIINLFLPKINRGREILIIERHIPIQPEIEDIKQNTMLSYQNEIKATSVNLDNFSSRFELDFDVISCIGKGGFGVVFEARNKLDDCNYAVKKIVLPDKEEKRNRVMREVKTLANCEHNNIVRYFQAWVETPPAGWQENNVFRYEDDSNSLECKTSNTFSESNFLNKNVEIYSMTRDVNEKNKLASHNLYTKYSHDYSKQMNTMSNDSFEITFERPNEEGFTKSNYYNDSISVKDNKNQSSPNVELNMEITQNKMYLYIQMQLCRKKSLRDWLNDYLPEQRIPYIQIFFEQILDAVSYVHSKGLIHRDLKPSNIFFSQNGQIKIGDFGLVTLMPETPAYNTNKCENSNNCKVTNSFYNHTGQVGTYLYMSPEQLNGKPYDYKVDIFSLGFIFFEMLVYFHTEMERITTLTSLRQGEFPSSFEKEFPEELVLLKQMLSNEPDGRPNLMEIKETILSMASWNEAKINYEDISNKNIYFNNEIQI